jgi:hypothetical protein
MNLCVAVVAMFDISCDSSVAGAETVVYSNFVVASSTALTLAHATATSGADPQFQKTAYNKLAIFREHRHRAKRTLLRGLVAII